jgi:hypothetical protein
MKYIPKNEVADPVLYRLIFSLMYRDILYKLGFDATKRNKEILHEFHKRVLGFSSISDKDKDTVSLFILSVHLFWAETHGFFIRTSRKQKEGIENMELSKLWDVL